VSKSLLQLEDCWVTRLDFKVLDSNVVVRDDASVPRLTWDIRKSEDEDSYLVSLRVSDNSHGSHLLMDLQGTFTFLHDTPSETQAKMIGLNGPAILYGIARGIVGALTGFSSGRRRMLPSVNVVDLVERKDRQRARSRPA
jgi:preprotein translocase subunit SecB